MGTGLCPTCSIPPNSLPVALGPCSPVGDLEEAPDQLLTSPAPASIAIWGVNSRCNSASQIS